MKAASFSPGASTGLLLIRLMLAATFIYHGCQILFGAFGGPGPANFASAMHFSLIMAYVAGALQLAGGLSMLTGFLVQLGALAIVCAMAGAIALVHWPHGFSITQNGMEYALTEAVVAIGIAFTGPGAYAITFPGATGNPRPVTPA